MPLYETECVDCGNQSEQYSKIEARGDLKCPSCNGQTRLLVAGFNRGFDFNPQFFEHLDTNPVWIENRQHLKKECKKRGLWAKCLD